jgi:hypothetical protein
MENAKVKLSGDFRFGNRLPVWFFAFDAGRHLMLITPGKRSAARGYGGQRSPATPEGVEQLRSSDGEGRSTPCCACGLHGVIHIRRLPASNDAQHNSKFKIICEMENAKVKLTGDFRFGNRLSDYKSGNVPSGNTIAAQRGGALLPTGTSEIFGTFRRQTTRNIIQNLKFKIQNYS